MNRARRRRYRMSRFMRWWLAFWCETTMMVFVLAIIREARW